MASHSDSVEQATLNVIKQLPGAVVLLSANEFQIKYVSDAFKLYMPKSFKRNDFIGVRFADFVKDGESNPAYPILTRISESGKGEEVKNYLLKNRNGGEFWVDRSGSPVNNETELSDVLVQFRDISDRRRTEEALKRANNELERRVHERTKELSESETKFRSLVEQSKDGVSLFDEDGRLIEWNRSLEEISKLRSEEVIGRHFWDILGMLITDEQRATFPKEKMKEMITEVLRTGKGSFLNRAIEVSFLRPDGEIRRTSQTVFPIKTEMGFRISSIVRDVTEERKAEEALKESEVKYHGLFDNIREGVVLHRFIYDKHGDIIEAVPIDANSAALKIYGANSIDELRGKMHHEVSNPNMNALDIDAMKGIRDRGKSITKEEYFYANDRYYMVTSAPLEKDFVVTTGVDITDIKQAQLQAEDERARLQTILDSLPVGVLVIDVNGRTLIRNKTMSDFLGNLPLSEGISDYARFHGYHPGTDTPLAPEDWPMARSVLKGETVNNEELDVQSTDGNRVAVLSSSMPIADKGGKIADCLAVFTDITKQKELERNLKRSNNDLQQFAYLASHDLQEPLRMVVSYLSLLERKYKDQLDSKAKKYMRFAVDGGERMRALIDDLLDYSRVDTQGKPFTPVDMNKIMDETINVLKVPIQENKVEIIVESLPNVMADESQMMQVLQNLVANAIKFHGPKRPKINVYASQNVNEWIIAVKDNGIGLNIDCADRIFQMFQRLHTRQEYQGTGVGLAIVKKIVERHGGRVWVKSEEGKGATFYFTIPTGRLGMRDKVSE